MHGTRWLVGTWAAGAHAGIKVWADLLQCAICGCSLQCTVRWDQVNLVSNFVLVALLIGRIFSTFLSYATVQIRSHSERGVKTIIDFGMNTILLDCGRASKQLQFRPKLMADNAMQGQPDDWSVLWEDIASYLPPNACGTSPAMQYHVPLWGMHLCIFPGDTCYIFSVQEDHMPISS